jgi:hypothetical protein
MCEMGIAVDDDVGSLPPAAPGSAMICEERLEALVTRGGENRGRFLSLRNALRVRDVGAEALNTRRPTQTPCRAGHGDATRCSLYRARRGEHRLGRNEFLRAREPERHRPRLCE